MYKSSGRAGRAWVLALFILAGIILGGFIANGITTALDPRNVRWLDWLAYGNTFGLTSPFTLDLGIVKLVFGLSVKFTVAGLILMIASVFLYRRFGR